MGNESSRKELMLIFDKGMVVKYFDVSSNTDLMKLTLSSVKKQSIVPELMIFKMDDTDDVFNCHELDTLVEFSLTSVESRRRYSRGRGTKGYFKVHHDEGIGVVKYKSFIEYKDIRPDVMYIVALTDRPTIHCHLTFSDNLKPIMFSQEYDGVADIELYCQSSRLLDAHKYGSTYFELVEQFSLFDAL